MINIIDDKSVPLTVKCESCNQKIIKIYPYKDKKLCLKCHDKQVSFDNDQLRKKYDIRNRDKTTLNWYQQGLKNILSEKIEK